MLYRRVTGSHTEWGTRLEARHTGRRAFLNSCSVVCVLCVPTWGMLDRGVTGRHTEGGTRLEAIHTGARAWFNSCSVVCVVCVPTVTKGNW